MTTQYHLVNSIALAAAAELYIQLCFLIITLWNIILKYTALDFKTVTLEIVK